MAKTRAWKQTRATAARRRKAAKAARKSNAAIARKAAHNAARGLKGSHPKSGVKPRKSQIWGIPEPLRVEAPKPALLLIDRAKIHEWTGAVLRKDEPMEEKAA